MPSHPALRRALREAREALLDALLPPACLACGEDQLRDGLCPDCRSELRSRLPEPGEPYCSRCQEPLDGDGRCPAEPHRDFALLRTVRAPFDYRGAAGALVRRCKFGRDPGAARALARAMLRACALGQQAQVRRGVLVSVPLHPRKLRRRGIDQAAVLAELCARASGLSHLPRALARTRDTLPQGDPRVTQRERNVADAFVLRRRRGLAGRPVLLVDDVYTSGATARACARILREGGASAVHLLTACRARPLRLPQFKTAPAPPIGSA